MVHGPKYELIDIDGQNWGFFVVGDRLVGGADLTGADENL